MVDCRGSPLNLLQGLPSGEASVNIMPPGDLVALAPLPTKQDHSAFLHCGEIDQAASIIFDLNAERIQFLRTCGQTVQKHDVSRSFGHTSTAAFSSCRSQFGLLLQRRDRRMGRPNPA